MMRHLKTVNNVAYKTSIDIGANEIKQQLWYIVNVLFFRNPLSISSRFKVFLLKLFGAKMGKGIVIKPSINIKYPWKLVMGNNTWIGENVWIDNLIDVTIGNNVCISQGALLLCGNHNYKKEKFDLILGAIILEDGVWIGSSSVVCPGITCRSHAVLSVGSIATKDLEAYSVYSGNPAKKIRERIIN